MRKKIIPLPVFFLMAFIIMVGTAQPSTYVFSPYDADLGDLDHNYYYKWGIKWDIPKGEIITGAEIRYYNIYNWQSESGDRLWTNLLNTVNDTNASSLPNYGLVNNVWL